MTESEINKEAAKFFPPQRYPFGLAFSQDDVVAFAQHCVDKATAWRPIADAPKDGTVVLLFGKWAGEIHGPNAKPSIDIGFWQGGKSDYQGDDWWSLTTGDAYACWINATHWKPLPPPEAA